MSHTESQKPHASAHIVNEALSQFIQSLPPFTKVFLAYSGGLDSSVLLDALSKQIHKQIHKQISLTALHVNHSLHADSAVWQAHCKHECESRHIKFHSFQISIEKTQRQGLESVARQKRYAVMSDYIVNQLKQSVQADEQQDSQYAYRQKSQVKAVLITAHHQRDQAETLLLNLFRGSGVQGLGGMRASRLLQNVDDLTAQQDEKLQIQLQRPLLQVPFASLEAYAKDAGVKYIEDPSNQDFRFKRNKVRHEILPLLNNAWNGLEIRLAKTAEKMQEASDLLDQIAIDEMQRLEHNDCFIDLKPAIKTGMGHAALKNLIRVWLKYYWPNLVLSARHFEWVLSVLNNENKSINTKQYGYFLPVGELKFQAGRLYYLPSKLSSYEYSFSTLNEWLGWLEALNSFPFNSKGFLTSFSFKINKEEQLNKVVLRSISADDKVNKKRLKAFFQANKIPAWLRMFWPVLDIESGADKSLLVLGCPQATEYLVGEENLVIELSYLQCLKLALN